MSLSPKIALVTGAPKGIGFEVARQLDAPQSLTGKLLRECREITW